jgi:hypothetical protein
MEMYDQVLEKELFRYCDIIIYLKSISNNSTHNNNNNNIYNYDKIAANFCMSLLGYESARVRVCQGTSLLVRSLLVYESASVRVC